MGGVCVSAYSENVPGEPEAAIGAVDGRRKGRNGRARRECQFRREGSDN